MRKNNVVFMNAANEVRGRKHLGELNQAASLIITMRIKAARQKNDSPFYARMHNAVASYMQLHPLHNYTGRGGERMMRQYHS